MEQINESLVRSRLKELFEGQTQNVVAKKIGIQQPAVSKLVTNEGQLPALDTLYHIAKEYDVSVDWILGLTDVRKPEEIKRTTEVTYAVAFETLYHMMLCGAGYKDEKEYEPITITIKDPILKALLRKGKKLSEADYEFFKQWKETELSKLEDKTLLGTIAWENEAVCFMAGEARKIDDYLKVYEEGKAVEDDWFEMASHSTSMFD